MNLAQLISYLKDQSSHSFCLYGPYGFVHATPNTKESERPTYTLDVSYLRNDCPAQTYHKDGFRLSTICCICACILYGESALDETMISRINAGKL